MGAVDTVSGEPGYPHSRQQHPGGAGSRAMPSVSPAEVNSAWRPSSRSISPAHCGTWALFQPPQQRVGSAHLSVHRVCSSLLSEGGFSLFSLLRDPRAPAVWIQLGKLVFGGLTKGFTI